MDDSDDYEGSLSRNKVLDACESINTDIKK